MFSQKKIDFINSIQYLKLDDITNNKCTLEGLKRVNPMFNEYNPVTYTIYLQSRQDLPNEERLYYEELIKRLVSKEKQLVEEAIKTMKTREEIKEEPVEIKFLNN